MVIEILFGWASKFVHQNHGNPKKTIRLAKCRISHHGASPPTKLVSRTCPFDYCSTNNSEVVGSSSSYGYTSIPTVKKHIAKNHASRLNKGDLH
jgi:hypothetical protein